MKTVYFTGVGEPLEKTNVPIPKPEEGWALVKVHAVSICGSDVHIREGHTPVRFTPIALGHEIAGEVVEINSTNSALGTAGATGENINVGDRVFINPIIGCRNCVYCDSGESNFCPNRGLLGIHFQGGMAEYVVAPTRNLTAMPENIPYGEIAMIESAGTAFHALRALDSKQGEALAVIGAGGLGLQVVRIAVAMGLRVVVIDPAETARARALEAGAEKVFSPEEIAAKIEAGTHVEIAEELGSQFGFPHVVDCVGFPGTIDTALNLLRPRGSCSVIGIGEDRAPLPEPGIFIRRSLQIRGIYTYTEEDITSVIQLMLDGKLDLSASISKTLPLDAAEEAFELFTTAAERPVRVVLEP